MTAAKRAMRSASRTTVLCRTAPATPGSGSRTTTSLRTSWWSPPSSCTRTERPESASASQTEPQDGEPDLDCQPGHIHVMEASLTGATSKTPQKSVVDAVGRPAHIGQVCQGGTTCVATGQDRRLGDYFTNALDAHGCVLIA